MYHTIYSSMCSSTMYNVNITTTPIKCNTFRLYNMVDIESGRRDNFHIL